MSDGRVFYSDGPATEKLRNCVREHGVTGDYILLVYFMFGICISVCVLH